MRKLLTILWTAALCASLLLACKKQPDVPPFTPTPLNPTPTNDVVNKTLDKVAFILGSSSSPEYTALNKRLINITNGGLTDPNLHTLVIGTAELNALNEEKAGQLRNLIVRGGEYHGA